MDKQRLVYPMVHMTLSHDLTSSNLLLFIPTSTGDPYKIYIENIHMVKHINKHSYLGRLGMKYINRQTVRGPTCHLRIRSITNVYV